MKSEELHRNPHAPEELLNAQDELLASSDELFRTPDDRFIEETDGDPASRYEDTVPHDRTGFRVQDSKPLDRSGDPDTRLKQNSGKPY